MKKYKGRYGQSKNYMSMSAQLFISIILVVLFSFAHIASAHVVVTPSEVRASSYQTFNISVPVERPQTVVSIRLVIPEGLENIRPTVKPGWKVSMVKEKRGDQEFVTELQWTGGTIPADFRDDFSFSAKNPASGTLIWKAYQTYSDGVVAAWDMDPAAEHAVVNHESGIGPYSKTVIKVVTTGQAMGTHAGHDGGIGGQTDGGIADKHASHQGFEYFLPLLAIAFSLYTFIDPARKAKNK